MRFLVVAALQFVQGSLGPYRHTGAVGGPADEVGLREGDVILAVNGKSVHKFKLQEVMGMINDKTGKRVRLLIERFNRDLLFSFVLGEVFE